MKTKLMSLVSLVCAVTIALAPVPAFAAYTPIQELSLATVSIGASGTVNSTFDLSVEVIGGTDLSFTPGAGEMVATAPEVLKVMYTDNTPGDTSLLVTTNNPMVDTNVMSGLVGANGTDTAPLFWCVFPTLAGWTEFGYENPLGGTFDLYHSGANDYASFTLFTAAEAAADVDVVEGTVNNTVHNYVVDRNQADFLTGTPTDPNAVLKYATVAFNIKGSASQVASVPEDNQKVWEQDGAIQYDPVSGDALIEARPTTETDVVGSNVNAVCYVRFAADYNDAPAQAYATTTLSLMLATIS